MQLVLRTQSDLTLETFEQVVWDHHRLILHPDLLTHIATSRSAMLAALQDGREVYGVTTGTGYLAGVVIPPEERPRHEAALLLGRAVGGPPYLDRDEACAVLLARIAGFLSGYAAVSPELCAFIADRLNDGLVPAIPRSGAGSAGEIIPLSHAFQTFLGAGQVLDEHGAPVAADAALRERGVSAYQPGGV
jgi:histidine ammonia-lyase